MSLVSLLRFEESLTRRSICELGVVSAALQREVGSSLYSSDGGKDC